MLGRMQASPPFHRHVEQRTVVLAEHKVLFLPMPKAGCTSVLWMLAELAGLSLEEFSESPLLEVSPALTVHDMNFWRPEHKLAAYEDAERERILTEDGWLRFTMVRDPATRLWSGWQSKLLLREPRFVEAFGDAPWFPRVPERPEEIIEDFRGFVAALPGGDAEDVHWAVQHDLTSQLPLDHVGRVERADDTLAILREHVGALPGAGRRENASPLPMPPDAYDAASRAILEGVYRADFEAFGYPTHPDTAPDPGWAARVEPLLGLLRTSIDEHARLAHVHEIMLRRTRRAQTAEERLETASARQVGHSRSAALTNLERHEEYNVRWAWSEGPVAPGFTAVLRVKNETRSLPWVLPPLLRAVERVVLVDNGSTDGTPAVARRVALEAGAEDRLDLHQYPFAIARCGPEHLDTPASSVHSLVHFYNWCFSQVRTGYALKWDGDMVLTDAAVNALRDLAWQLEAGEVIVKVPRYPLYLVDDRRAFVDVSLRNVEPWGWPNRPGYSFAKAMDWELPLWSPHVPSLVLPDWGCVELKHLDADEFAHWSHTDFAASERTQRKRREFEVFNALAGGAAPPPHVEEVVAPAGVHVIEHVRTSWLPARAGQRQSGPMQRLIRSSRSARAA